MAAGATAASLQRNRRVTAGESLDVTLKPGEMLLLHGAARSWVSTVTGWSPGAPGGGGSGPSAPFDFAHYTLLDLRAFERSKRRAHERLLNPPPPSARDGSWKWMQCSYTVLSPAGEDPSQPEAATLPATAAAPTIELRGAAPK